MLLVLFLLATMPLSHAETDIPADRIYGSWTRVGDGCRLLDEEETARLAQNGGGNSARRVMTISFRETSFSAHFKPSHQCEGGFRRNEPVDFGNRDIMKACEAPLHRQGGLSLLGNNILQLRAEDCFSGYENPWGCDSRDWKIRMVGGTLVLNALLDNDECGATPFYIYFIPTPSS